MKKLYYLLLLLSTRSLISCPTCIGHLHTDTPTPFFSDEHYKSPTQDDLHSQVAVETGFTDNTQENEQPQSAEDTLP
jgi:hypothetical protein